ncbi:metal ABC transporter ATP-binding protein [Synechococcus sp. Nb3U1]|uniref:metal ABC transporter ATP-binding protein n=1 Tax=Synechococcus sp. Nb3U1 TaxID=1914529 RepID=UPI001F417CAF|nr:metal ABC transporter ATP-binding protein [Synechococcus sp. Nb3U1]MCF2972413.1 metal ABC transporter ATP-binding protein [Synechococcus sp. Nb3U1]
MYIRLQDVWVAYGEQAVLQGIDLHIPMGSLVAVVGPNGAGKSTLFKAMVGLLPLWRGAIQVGGGARDLSGSVAYIPQREEVDWRFPVTVLDVVLMGRYGQRHWHQRLQASDREIAWVCLERLGLAGLATASIGELSGGQQQRVFLARALAQQPRVLLMDEPLSGVDVSHQEVVLQVLAELQKQGVTILLSTHDLGLVWQRFQQVLLLNRRVIAFGPCQEVMVSGFLQQTFAGQWIILPDGSLLTQPCVT